MKTTKFEDVLNTSTEKSGGEPDKKRSWPRGAGHGSRSSKDLDRTGENRRGRSAGADEFPVPYARSALPPKPARSASQPGLFLRCSAASSASCVSLTRGMCLVVRATPASLVRRFIFTCVWLPSVNLITFSPLPLSCTVFTARHLASFVDLHTLCQTKKVCQCHDRMSVACCFNTWPHDSVAL